MAIDSKIISPEAAQQEQQHQHSQEQYRQRNDTAWSEAGAASTAGPPPPAYEEAASSSSASQQAPASSAAATEAATETSDRSNSSRADAAEADEASPLLTRRMMTPSQRKLRRRRRFLRFLLIVFTAWLFAGIILAFIMGTGLSAGHPPLPPASDGEAAAPAHWSAPILAPRPSWPTPDRPVYQSTANFTLDAFAPHLFFHANGWGYQGTVEVLEHEEHDECLDVVLVRMTATFSDEKSRNEIGVYKMRKGKEEGVVLYAHELHLPADAYVSFNVRILLPLPTARSPKGLTSEGLSWIASLGIFTETLRITVDDLAMRFDDKQVLGLLLGNFSSRVGNGESSFVSLSARDSIQIQSGNGHARDFGFIDPSKVSLSARTIRITSDNGAVGFNALRASESIHVSTQRGGVVLSRAEAPNIELRNSVGVVTGKLVGSNISVSSVQGSINIAVELQHPSANASLSHANATLDVSTEAADIEVNIAFQPRDLALHSRVQSELGSVRVKHARYFQGDWRLQTQLGMLSVVAPPDEVGHRWIVDKDKAEMMHHVMQGRCWWEDGAVAQQDKKHWGTSRVESRRGLVNVAFR